MVRRPTTEFWCIIYLLFIMLVWVLLVHPYYIITIPFAIGHLGWYHNTNESRYICSDYSEDLLWELKLVGFRAHYVYGTIYGNNTAYHAWIAIEDNGQLVHIEPQNGFIIEKYNVIMYDTYRCSQNKYNEPICPSNNNTIINTTNEEILFGLSY